MRICAPTLSRYHTLFRRLSGRSGQFVPLASMILFTSVLLMVAGMNVYRITKAKLQVQNMADAAALAVASMEAKAVNTVVDRNEWLNHMYGPGYKHNSNSVPNISDPNKKLNQKTAEAYANLVATINKAQGMFITAYDNFLGASPANNTASNGSGNAALADILSEITGLQNPDVLAVWVYNNNTGRPDDATVSNVANAFANSDARTSYLGNKLSTKGMEALKFETVKVDIKADKDMTTLTKLAKSQDEVGWVRPLWNDPKNTLDVQVTKNGGTELHWGAGVTIVKEVRLFLFGRKKVRANSLAYVVNTAGVASGGGDPQHPSLPSQFKPTFYAQLAYHS